MSFVELIQIRFTVQYQISCQKVVLRFWVQIWIRLVPVLIQNVGFCCVRGYLTPPSDSFPTTTLVLLLLLPAHFSLIRTRLFTLVPRGETTPRTNIKWKYYRELTSLSGSNERPTRNFQVMRMRINMTLICTSMHCVPLAENLNYTSGLGQE